jgi:hypothetical protein
MEIVSYSVPMAEQRKFRLLWVGYSHFQEIYLGMQRHRKRLVCELLSLRRNMPASATGVLGGLHHLPSTARSTPPRYHATADPWNRIATDNQGLIARIKDGLTSKTVFAGAALSAEYEVVHEIIEITNRLPLPLTWEHVKGHQDKHRKWYELTWMETLNIRADYHATQGLATEGNPSTLVTLIPSSKLGLRIATTDITSHYTSHLRKAATRPVMLKRAQKHYGWLESQFDMIDWTAHHGGPIFKNYGSPKRNSSQNLSTKVSQWAKYSTKLTSHNPPLLPTAPGIGDPSVPMQGSTRCHERRFPTSHPSNISRRQPHVSPTHTHTH